MKKQILIPLCSAVGVLVIGGTIFGITKYRDSKTEIDVIPVENISAYYYGDYNSSQGLVTSNVSQEVYLQSDQLVKKMYVQEGDTVSIGDKILEYDMTLKEIDRSSKEIEQTKIDMQITNINKQIANLRAGNYNDIENFTPSGPSYQDNTQTSSNLAHDGLLLASTHFTMSTTGDIGDGNSGESTDETTVPETTAPETTVPETTAPETTTPGTTTPGTTTPGTTTPDPTPNPDLPHYDPAKRLDYDSKIFKTTEGGFPIVYCDANTIITQAFFNKLLGLQENGEPFEDDQEHEAKDFFFILMTDEDNATYLIRMDELALPEEGLEECTMAEFFKTFLPDDTPEDPGIDDPGSWGGGGGGIYYTAAEVNQMITERQLEIAKLLTSKKQAELDLKKLDKELENSVVTSTINGIVKSAGDPETGVEQGKPFVVIDSQDGFYLTGDLSELQLNHIKVGDTVNIQSWMSGTSCDATITEIADYPTDSSMSYSDNPNVSFYPFKAYIDDASAFSNNEYVSITFNESNNNDSDALYIYNAYVREDNGQSYVYVRDENGRLKKQEVVTGNTIYGSYIEIKEGLNRSDYVAFPYGKGLKNGARTKEVLDAYY